MIKLGYIKKLKNGKYRVYSEKGRNMGTYDSEKAAKQRLREIEFFKHKADFIADLNKLANYFDDIGLFQEANLIDQFSKQAAEMSSKEYERYYGKSKYESSGKELDVSKPEDYKKYYGRDLPQPSAIPQPVNRFKVGDEVVVEKIPERYKNLSSHYSPSLGEILEVIEVHSDRIVASGAGRRMYDFKPDELSLYNEPEQNDADWQIELVNIVESMRNTRFSRDAKLYVDTRPIAGTVVATLRFRSDISKNAFLNHEMPNLKDFRPTSKDKKDQYVVYYSGGYVWVKSSTYDDEILSIVNTKNLGDAPKAREILKNLTN